jgi:NAD(P)-dependent dehydrogenase (short-subunit alcohol dehydrogenase family)
MIIITGWRSQIASEFRDMLGLVDVRHGKPLEPDFPLNADYYLFCQGLLRPKRMQDQTETERKLGFAVNLDSIKRACDAVLAVNDSARICIIGSESAYLGSYDDCYAISKMLIHSYVENKELKPMQQIVAISPGIIEDAGMTTRRKDLKTLRKAQHPMRRFLRAREVAELAHHLLYHQPYIRNTVIRMHGGLK